MTAVLQQVAAPMQRLDEIKISCNAATQFVRSYYDALSHTSTTTDKLVSYYAPVDTHTNALVSLFSFRHIWYNGNEFVSPTEFATAVKEYLTPARYEVDSFDCQPLNTDLNPTRELVADPSRGGAMSMLLSVAGSVRIGPPKESESVDFSETIVLVPNLEFDAARKARRPAQEWVIASQIFRNV